MGTLIVTIVASAGASLLGMAVADHFLTHRIAIIGSFAGLQLSHNPGIAFGIRLPPAVQSILIGIALIIVFWIALLSVRDKKQPNQKPVTRNQQLAFGLILGGGIANIIDRSLDGLVTDFVQIGTFPVFNLADTCITVGVLVLLLELFKKGRRMKRQEL